MTSLIARVSSCLLAALALPLSLNAQDYEPATTSYPAADPDGEVLDALQPGIEARKSFNVHLHSGEFFVEYTDLAIAGRGFDFEWKRTYRSRADRDGPMGYNWDHSYNIYIEQDGTDLILYDGDFREDRFIPTQTANVWGAPGQFRTIYLNQDGSYTVLLRHNSKWELHPLDGANTEGKLRAIIDRNGNAMVFEYANRTGRLIRIKDTLHEDVTNERIIDVRYNADGYISEIEDFCTDLGVAGAGRKVTYTYWNTTPVPGGGEAMPLASRNAQVAASPPRCQDVRHCAFRSGKRTASCDFVPE